MILRPLQVIQPSRVTVMIKPVGALCNMDCAYCYYLPTKTIYGGHQKRMSPAVLEQVFASVLPRFGDEVIIAWQGGEPTLAGLDFFRKAIIFQERYRRPGQVVRHALQTNGSLLDDDWCRFLNQHRFLVGLSVDGPPRFHDHYRVTNAGERSSPHVLRGLRFLRRHRCEFNLLCVLNDRNVQHPDEVWDYLLTLGTTWLQFIPAIEWVTDPANPGGNALAPYSPAVDAYGRFLCRTFDRWFDHCRDRVSVREFDAVLNKLVLGRMPYCILDAACHNQLTVEHDGSVFGCDHFVERRWQLAKINDHAWKNTLGVDGSENVGLTVHGSGYEKLDTHGGRDIAAVEDVPVDDTPLGPLGLGDSGWFDRVDADRLAAFAGRKQRLPAKCLGCKYKAFCHGGCPKHRPTGGEHPEPTVLCEAYLKFYDHAMDRLLWLAEYLRKNQQPPPPRRKKGARG